VIHRRPRSLAGTSLFFLSLAAGCGGGNGSAPNDSTDATSAADTSVADTSSADTSATDTSNSVDDGDVGASDATTTDAASTDATSIDTATTDATSTEDALGEVAMDGAPADGDDALDAEVSAPEASTDATCAPSKTCTSMGASCGRVDDGCGTMLDCGTCTSLGETCGGGGTANQCGCSPRSCSDQGFTCGKATDGCEHVIDCGTCSGALPCGLVAPNVCGTPGCTGLCLQQVSCPTAGTTTTVRGTVYAPNGTDPLPGVLVYVPNGGAAPSYGVTPFPPGASTGGCAGDLSGAPLVSTTTGYDGSFTLSNAPAGTNIPLVLQIGRWRRKITIPSVAACMNTSVPPAQTRLPTKPAEFDPADNIPAIAISTGATDGLECIIRKIGVADSQFGDPKSAGGSGRIALYAGAGAPGATFSSRTPSDATLTGGLAEISQYDMVLFGCQGAEFLKTGAQQSTLSQYVNAGGRVFATHYGYVWFVAPSDGAPTNPWTATASWMPNAAAPTPDPQTGYIDTGDARGTQLANWLMFVHASTTFGQLPLAALRHDFTAVVAPAFDWLSLGSTSSTTPMLYSFETPVGGPPATQIGRVMFNDFHVENVMASGATFPAECSSLGGPMTPQEKLLEYMLFDLDTCVAPPSCTPKRCASTPNSCGPTADGCGAILDCGACASGQNCVGGTCVTP
jgi:hypothetical protein